MKFLSIIKLSLACIMFFFVCNLFANENGKIEQLERQIATASNNKQKVDLMQELVDYYLQKTNKEFKDVNKEKIIKLGEDALDLSEKTNYEKGKIIAYGQLADIYKYFGVPNQYLKYSLKYKQNKSQLAKIQEAEIAEIKRLQALKEAEIRELEKDKSLNAELIEQKKAELDKANNQLNTTIGKIKEKDYLIGEKENEIADGKTKIRAAHDSIEEQNRINQTLLYEKKILEDEKKIISLSEKAAKSRNWMFVLMGIVGVVIALSLGILLISMRRNQNKLKEKNDLIKAEKERSEELLLNILPAEMAKELKQNGFAKAQSFDNVTVFFSDFKDFTKISEQLSPSELVAEIDVCFKAFDNIISKYDIEKIKTVGDAYICVAGLDKTKKHNPVQMVEAAIEIRNFVENRIKKLQKDKKPYFEIRIGIHTGPIVAGIVGFKKFAYDIWGDTVNTAARMEQNSVAGKINVSSSTYELVKEQFSFTYRGKIEAKNKGQIDMYFIHERSDNVLVTG